MHFMWERKAARKSFRFFPKAHLNDSSVSLSLLFEFKTMNWKCKARKCAEPRRDNPTHRLVLLPQRTEMPPERKEKIFRAMRNGEINSTRHFSPFHFFLCVSRECGWTFLRHHHHHTISCWSTQLCECLYLLSEPPHNLYFSFSSATFSFSILIVKLKLCFGSEECGGV